MEGRLLLVDDEVAVLDVLSEYFVAQGYDVETAASGEDALRRVRGILGVAVQLGDVDATTRDAMAAAVGAARRALPAA
jgi:CheY-like chemotaxis protein